MNSVNKTLYIPLYGKSYVSKKGLFLDDKKAEEIWTAEGFSLKGKSKSKWLAYYMGIRSAVFDEWLKEQIPSDVNIFNIMKYANQVMNSIKIEIDDTLEDNVVKIKEEEK